MAINQSRKNDARSWNVWRTAGAIGCASDAAKLPKANLVPVTPQVPATSPVLTLPTDNPERIAQLGRKLEEYKARLADRLASLGSSVAYMAPEALSLNLGSTPYRILVLERLLRDRKVETWSFSKELAAQFKVQGKFFAAWHFDKACNLIKDYAETGGKNLYGGTGLK